VTRRIPIFPLPGVVLLPGTLLPLHIFEPRYRAMVADALAGDRTIGMAMWKAGAESDPGEPRIHEIGGAGEIVESERLDDGRYNVVLEGRFRFRVLDEAPPSPYRIARVVEVPSRPLEVEIAARVTEAAAQEYAPLARAAGLPPLPAEALTPERLVSELALRLRYAPIELQAILEADSLAARYETVLSRIREWTARMELLAPFRGSGEIDPRMN
jgi:Lon protease-like protein